MKPPKNISKLKRDRKNPNAKAARLFSDSGSSRIESCSPTPEAPALRRFVPPADLDVREELVELGILDWRKDSPTPLADLNQVADKIICADSESALRRLPAESVDCVITSPPYWNVVDYGFAGQLGACPYEEYLEQLLRVFRECERVLVPNGKLCLNAPIMPISKKVMPDQHNRHLKNIAADLESLILARSSLQRFSLYIWQKQTTEKIFGSYPYPPNLYEQNTVEFIGVFVKPGKPKTLPKAVKEKSRLSEREWMNLTRQVWSLYPEDVKRVSHPAPFPESLPNRLIAMYTFRACPDLRPPFAGDLVLDPFNGTGATCVAAKKLGRRYLGIDLSPHFCVTAQRRLTRATPDPKIFLTAEKSASGPTMSPPLPDQNIFGEPG